MQNKFDKMGKRHKSQKYCLLLNFTVRQNTKISFNQYVYLQEVFLFKSAKNGQKNTTKARKNSKKYAKFRANFFLSKKGVIFLLNEKMLINLKSEFVFRCPAEKELTKIKARKSTQSKLCIIHFVYRIKFRLIKCIDISA